MLINYNTTITGERVVLVPYRPEHVALYHQWMTDPHLQETTESEPLTLEEEYQMQQSWRDDPDKCTFILLDPARPDTPGTGTHGGAMAGDVNLYFNEPEDRATAEIEIMVAEPTSRGRGMAQEALRLMMAFAVSRLGVRTFRAKILQSNGPSLSLFEKKMGFVLTRRVEVFKEVHYELAVGEGPGSLREALEAEAAKMKLSQYDQA